MADTVRLICRVVPQSTGSSSESNPQGTRYVEFNSPPSTNQSDQSNQSANQPANQSTTTNKEDFGTMPVRAMTGQVRVNTHSSRFTPP